VTILSGFVYVAVILDALSRKVVGYAIARSIEVRLTLAALRCAIERPRPPPGCVHHTDRGPKYAARRYPQALADHGLIGSMGRRGNPYDNAKAESFKASRSHVRSIRFIGCATGIDDPGDGILMVDRPNRGLGPILNADLAKYRLDMNFDCCFNDI